MAIENCMHGQQTISIVITPVFPPDWDVKLEQTFIHLVRFVVETILVDK